MSTWYRYTKGPNAKNYPRRNRKCKTEKQLVFNLFVSKTPTVSTTQCAHILNRVNEQQLCPHNPFFTEIPTKQKSFSRKTKINVLKTRKF